MLRESAALAASTGAYWQTHVSEDRAEIAEVARLFPEALDYVDVYDRAGGLGARTVLAHAVHLSDRELGRLVETGTHVAHCPASNLFLGVGRHAARALPGGRPVDRARVGRVRRPGPVDLLRDAGRRSTPRTRMRVAGRSRRAGPRAARLAADGDARRGAALGLDDAIGSLEAGKEADLIAVDPAFVAPLPGAEDDDPDDLMSRLIFRAHPGHGPGRLGARPPARGTGRARLIDAPTC